jgi:hypothetical protein
LEARRLPQIPSTLYIEVVAEQNASLKTEHCIAIAIVLEHADAVS